jgi:RNA polymerase sigma-70 factor (ECF subfamily)
LSNSDVRKIKLTDLEANELAAQVRQGKQEAGSKLYDAYVEDIYYYFYRRTKNKDVAQDLTSDTFLSAIKELLNGTWSGDLFPIWLAGIAKDVFVEWRKIQPKRSDISVKDFNTQKEDITDEDIVEEILARERFLIIWEAVDQLPKDFSSILKLRYIDGLSYAKISSKLGEPVDACRALHHRAMEMLREQLKRTGKWNELKRDQANVS